MEFDDLPDDTIYNVMTQLSFSTLVRLGQVNKRMFKLYQEIIDNEDVISKMLAPNHTKIDEGVYLDNFFESLYVQYLDVMPLIKVYYVLGKIGKKNKPILDGPYRSYYDEEKTKLCLKALFVNGDLGGNYGDTLELYRWDGTLCLQIPYKYNRKNGPLREYDENESLINERYYLNDTLEGPSTHFSPEGRILSRIYYSGGKPLGEKTKQTSIRRPLSPVRRR